MPAAATGWWLATSRRAGPAALEARLELEAWLRVAADDPWCERRDEIAFERAIRVDLPALELRWPYSLREPANPGPGR